MYYLAFHLSSILKNNLPANTSCKCYLTSFLNLVNNFQTLLNLSPYWHLTFLPDFSDPSLLWLFSYFSVHSFLKSLPGFNSSVVKLHVGPQGLASRPFLFSLYIFSFGNVIHYHALNYCCLYANDSLVYSIPGHTP